MDLAKFVLLLRNRGLHFTRADRLGDEFEGALTSQTVAYWLLSFEGQERGLVVFGPPGLEGTYPDAMRTETKDYRPVFGTVVGETTPEVRMLPEPVLARCPEWTQREYRGDAREHRQALFVSCWHANEHESAAMWDLYARSGAGIAIRSSVARLKACFTAAADHPVWIGRVRYRDYATEAIWGASSGVAPTMTKRRSFAHENEVRAVFYAARSGNRYRVSQELYDFVEEGMDIPTDLDTLIECIVVAPQARGWFKDLVRGVIEDYGLGNKEVVTSSLDDRPLW
jgi:hypothetical protein